jgi:hypothetical protein
MSKEFDDLLREAFPTSSNREVVRVVGEGVALADDVRRNTPWLTNLIGDDLRGSLRRAATFFRFAQACKEGTLPFEAEEIENTNGSSHLLKVEAGAFEAHIVRTDSDGAFPRDAPIRQDNRLRNQGDLFEEPNILPLAEIKPYIQKMYAWLTFNADLVGRLTHVYWCMPERDRNMYLGRANVLKSGLGEMPIEPASPPPPDPKTRMKFKDFIGDAIETNKKKSI